MGATKVVVVFELVFSNLRPETKNSHKEILECELLDSFSAIPFGLTKYRFLPAIPLASLFLKFLVVTGLFWAAVYLASQFSK